MPNSRSFALFKAVWHWKILFGMYAIFGMIFAFFSGMAEKNVIQHF